VDELAYAGNRCGSCQATYPVKSPALKRALEKAATRPGCLMMVLEALQEEAGNLEKSDLEELSQALCIPLSEIYGVATFYHGFKLSKAAKHAIRVCTGTACHSKGDESLLAVLRDKLGIEPGQSTADGRFSLEVVRCFGACALAPVVKIDNDIHGKVTPESLPTLLERYT